MPLLLLLLKILLSLLLLFGFYNYSRSFLYKPIIINLEFTQYSLYFSSFALSALNYCVRVLNVLVCDLFKNFLYYRNYLNLKNTHIPAFIFLLIEPYLTQNENTHINIYFWRSLFHFVVWLIVRITAFNQFEVFMFSFSSPGETFLSLDFRIVRDYKVIISAIERSLPALVQNNFNRPFRKRTRLFYSTCGGFMSVLISISFGKETSDTRIWFKKNAHILNVLSSGKQFYMIKVRLVSAVNILPSKLLVYR